MKNLATYFDHKSCNNVINTPSKSIITPLPYNPGPVKGLEKRPPAPQEKVSTTPIGPTLTWIVHALCLCII